MSSGRYRSRLFSLLSNQSLRLKDHVGRGWRQAKVTATWGAQILLYPIYALFQSTRMINRQFQQAARRSLPRLWAARQTIEKVVHPNRSLALPKADTPVQRVLQTVKAMVLPDAPERISLKANLDSKLLLDTNLLRVPRLFLDPKQAGNESSGGKLAAVSQPGSLAFTPPESNPLVQGASDHLSQISSDSPLEIQGIASLIKTQSLVLVTLHNHILDVLSLDQQHYLHQQIARELADYWRYHRVLKAAQRPLPPFLPPLPTRPQALPPVRLFHQLMGWMQQGPVAIATNLFQESTLALYRDAILQARAEIVWGARHQLGNQNADSTLLLESSPTPTLDALNPSQDTASSTAAILAHWNRQQLVAIAQAKLDAMALPANSPPVEKTVPPTPIPASNLTPDLLLQNRSASLQPSFQKRLMRLFAPKSRGGAITPAAPSPLVVQSKSSPGSLDVTTPRPKAVQSTSGVTSVEQSESGATALATAAMATLTRPGDPTSQAVTRSQDSWIETEATVVGYVKHPLERVLEWLDRGMLWLEDRLALLWRWLVQKIRP